MSLDDYQLTPVDYDPFLSGALEKVIPLTPEQIEIYLSSVQSEHASAAYNLAVSYRFPKDPDWAILNACINQLVARHEVLRSTIGVDNTVLCVAQSLDVPLPTISFDQNFEESSGLKKMIDKEALDPFNLSEGPLIRSRGVQLNNQSVLIITFHHIIVDGWSIDLISDELAQLYKLMQDTSVVQALPDAPLFSDYYVQQQQRKTQVTYQKTLDFWLTRYKHGVPVLDLPLSPGKIRPTIRSYSAARFVHAIDSNISVALLNYISKTGKTLFSFNYAIYLVFLHKLTSQCDLVVGVPSAGQPTSGSVGLVGQCVSMLPLRHTIDPALSVSEWVGQVSDELYDAQDHNQLSFGDLLSRLTLARDPSRVPMISTVFNIDSGRVDRQFGDMPVAMSHNPRAFETFELTILLAKNKDELSLECHYNTDLFSESTIASWLEQYQCLLSSALADPQCSLKQLNRLPGSHKAQLDQWNQTEIELAESTLHQMIESTTHRFPDQRAVVFKGSHYTYQTLNNRANQLAHYLLKQGVSSKQMIAICVERSADMVITILGILKAGAAYLPLDPLYPPERIAYILEDAQAPLLITQQSLQVQMPEHEGNTLLVDSDWPRIQSESTDAPNVTSSSDDLAYVIYTSGSTGNPKGVQITHGNVVNFLTTMSAQPGLHKSDRLLAVTTLSFDIHVLELYLPLVTGGEVHVASRELTLDGPALVDYIKDQQVSVMQATPATWRLMLQGGWTGSPSLKALVGGEALPPDLLEPLLANVSELWNMYGPTETTVWSTCCKITQSQPPISIGHAIGNTRLYVLDDSGHRAPIGAPGELCIAGAGVTKGYLHLPEMTHEKFVSNPFESSKSLMYRTGDLVSFHTDGQLYYHHRLDNQVKVRGYRIELGEIESIIADIGSVLQVVVIVREDTVGDARLVAYLVVDESSTLSSDAIKSHCKQRLPHYMIPAHIVTVPEMPQTPNGKLDRKALPKPTLASNPVDPAKRQPATEVEQFIINIWSELIGSNGIQLDDNFFEIGGHSLLAIQFINRIHQQYVVKLNFQAMVLDNLGQLARAIERESPQLIQADVRVSAHSVNYDALAIPFYFDQGQLYGTYYPPAVDVISTPKSVLICGPVSYEYQCTHRILNLLAEKLAKRGVAVLRFDYKGTGDSMGEDFQVDLDTWKDNITKAYAELHRRSGVKKPTILGIRLGANLAYSLKDQLNVAQWLLWQPISNGRRHVNLLHKMHLSLLRDAGRYKQIKKLQLNAKGHEYLGFVYSATLINQLNHLTISIHSEDPVSVIYNRANRDVEWMQSLAEPNKLHSLDHECEWYDLTRVSDMYTDISIITTVNQLMNLAN
ncbi:amino acid adenylation domain-containing protein [bacterium]|nr:amino acid adenylation domain-containing protein [bacterium]